MRTFRARTGPFREQPYFTDDEIETVCSDALRATGLLPESPVPIRIERFIEKRFGVTPKYEALGEDILGLTVFGAEGVKEVYVSSSLDEENSVTSEHRVRSTLAHEGGHGLFHTHLFALATQHPLFGDHSDPQKPKVLCREGNVATNGYTGEWWEFQANKAIGALLLPRTLVEHALERYLTPTGLLGFKKFDFSKEVEATRLLSESFNVSLSAARFRLQQVFPLKAQKQLTL